MGPFDEPTELLTAWAEAVNGNDTSLLAEMFTVDATFVNLFGSIWEGRQAIVDGHAWAFGSVLADSTMMVADLAAQPVDDTVAVVRGACERGRPPGASEDTLPPGTTVLLLVAQRTADGWKAVAGSNVARPQ